MVLWSGITPTYMGNTTTDHILSNFCLDHPHIHGEYSPINVCSASVAGSPPHTWGIQHQSRLLVQEDRITPTYMGNTERNVFKQCLFTDHPHIHGEYEQSFKRTERGLGSPPHTWGIPMVNHGATARVGITPTYMGNTRVRVKRIGVAKDHPHIHGEYGKRIRYLAKQSGSPPHTWGIPPGGAS